MMLETIIELLCTYTLVSFTELVYVTFGVNNTLSHIIPYSMVRDPKYVVGNY
jgi:hypothetical protein